MNNLDIHTPLIQNYHNNLNRKRDKLPNGNVSFFAQNETVKKIPQNDNILAFIGSTTGVGLVLGGMMKHQRVKNPFNLEYKVQHMISMAGCADIGGILLSSIGKNKKEKK